MEIMDKKDVKKNKKIKIIIITICIIISVITTIVMLGKYLIIFVLSGISLIQESGVSKEQIEVENEANEIVKIKLKEKYPERNFEITDTYVYIVPPAYIFGSESVARNSVYVYIKEKDDEYTVCVNCNDKSISDNIQEKDKVKKRAEQIATINLKEKYPKRKFEIIHIKVEDKYHHSSNLSVKEDEVLVYVKENNEEYNVCVNCKDKVISDNIQTNEICEAIKKKINEIIDIDSNVKEYEIWTLDSYLSDDKTLYFYEKYNGDIIDFLTKENKKSHIAICILYNNGRESFKVDKSSDKFLRLFNSVLLINYNDKKPSYDLHTLWRTFENGKYIKEYWETSSGESEIEGLYTKNSINSIYIYDKGICNFQKLYSQD